MKKKKNFNPRNQGLPYAPMIEGILLSPLKDSAKILLTCLIHYAGNDGKAYPKRGTLAKNLCWTIRKLDGYIKYLKDEQLIKTHKPHIYSASVYTFLDHKYYYTKKLSKNSATQKGSTSATQKCNRRPTQKCNTITKPIENKTNENNNNISNEIIQRPLKGSLQNENEKGEKQKQGQKLGKKKIILSALGNFNYSLETRKILLCWKECGGTVHVKAGSKGPGQIDDMIEELCIEGRNPYSKLVDNYNLRIKQWTVEEIISCIKYHTQTLHKDISKKYFNTFILFRNNKYNAKQRGTPDFSPLAESFTKIQDSMETKRSKKLKKKFKNGNEVLPVIFTRAANNVTEVEKIYKVATGASHTYYDSVFNVFIEYIQEKNNSDTFKLGYIAGQTFADNFVDDMMDRHILEKI